MKFIRWQSILERKDLTDRYLTIGRNLDDNSPDPKYWAEENLKVSIATQDHMRSNEKQKSFPLVAMQYALRHLVRCTEFCLVCHCKVEADFEALKPYVCSKPLCLYQYMSLGFGPSIEHEIIIQPHVVDLLVSFCYASACARKMKYLPTGMALMVPDPQAMSEYGGLPTISMGPVPLSTLPNGPPSAFTSGATNSTISGSKHVRVIHTAKFDQKKMEMLFPGSGARVPLHVGTWITIESSNQKYERMHCRVIESMHPIIRLSDPIVAPTKLAPHLPPDPSTSSQEPLSATSRAKVPQTQNPRTPPAAIESLQSSYRDVVLTIYDQNFDDLQDSGKYAMIRMLLETLPSIPEMQKYLLGRGTLEASLRHWSDRITPAALGLLRWIIASNRSCIVQVDSLEGVSRKSEERVCGMPGWMQFRFAQGAPDKEQRFVTSIRETTPGMRHPTIFAWHGSPLHNWHGIVREGLHFERRDHGGYSFSTLSHSLTDFRPGLR